MNGAAASVTAYDNAILRSIEMDGAILSEMEESGIWKLSGELGESEGLTAASLQSVLSDGAWRIKAETARSENVRFLGRLAGYFSQYEKFAREANESYIFRTNCSRLANWSLFECSADSWLTVSAVCMSHLQTCAEATDCQATISYNVTKLRADPPDFSEYWKKAAEISPLPDSFSRYGAYSVFSKRAAVLEGELRQSIISQSESVLSRAGEAKRSGLAGIPVPVLVDFFSARKGGALAVGRAEYLNFSRTISYSEDAATLSSRKMSALANLSLSERVLALKELKNSLDEAAFSIDAVFSIAKELEIYLDGRISVRQAEALAVLPQSERIMRKAALVSLSEDSDSLSLVASSPTFREFQNLSVLGLSRWGEGLEGIWSGREEILLALDERYGRGVNSKREEILSRQSSLSAADLAEFRKYEFLAPGGWIYARNAWGFLSLLEREYSDILSRAGRIVPIQDLEERLVQPVTANGKATVGLDGTIQNPSAVPIDSAQFEFGAAKVVSGKLDLLWSDGGTISSISSGRDGSFSLTASVPPFSTLSFSAEQEIPPLVRAVRVSSVESSSSDEYSLSERFEVFCGASFSGGFLLPIETVLPRDALLVSTDAPFFSISENGLVLSAECPADSISVNLTYLRPILLEYSGIPGGLSVRATNRLAFPLSNSLVNIPLPENSSGITLDGEEVFQMADGTVGKRVSLGAGEARTLLVKFSAGASSSPTCEFCCGIEERFSSLPAEKRAEIQRHLPSLISEAAKLTGDEILPVEKLACQDKILDALDLTRKTIAGRQKISDKNCAKISSMAATDRRMIGILKARADKILLLKSRFPSADFSPPPDLSLVSMDVLAAEQECDEWKIISAEEDLSAARNRTADSLAEAASWAYGFFSTNYSLSLSLPISVTSAVEKKIGTKLRELAPIPLPPEPPSPDEYEVLIDSVLAGKFDGGKKLVSIEEEAKGLLDNLDPGEVPPAAITYLNFGKAALSEGRLLDGLYAGHYAAILADEEKSASSSRNSTIAKIVAVVFSLLLAGAVIFYKGRGKKPKGDDSDIFGEIK
jgi:hypothetical protein